MGKWTEKMRGKPVYQNTEPRYQDKVEAVKAPLRASQLSPSDIASSVVREKKSKIEDQLSEVNLELEARNQLLIDLYDQAGIENLKLSSGHAIRTQVEPNAVVRDKAKFRQWCLDNGYQELMALPWQTTNSITKDKLMEGEAEPDGVEVFARTKVILTAPRKAD